jgi:hypothetical protein
MHLLSIPTNNLVIPLRYYRGWTIEFSVKTESFNCPMLCLYGFDSTKNLEKAVDFALWKRDGGVGPAPGSEV